MEPTLLVSRADLTLLVSRADLTSGRRPYVNHRIGGRAQQACADSACHRSLDEPRPPRLQVSAAFPTLYALRPTPYTLHPTPYTLPPTPYTYTLHPTPYTLHHDLEPPVGMAASTTLNILKSQTSRSEPLSPKP